MLTINTPAESSPEAVFEAIIRPNQSMNSRNLAVLVICFSVVSLAIALSFFSVGLWLVLPFAGLEIFLVGFVVAYSIRHSQGYERLIITDGEVRITKISPKFSQDHCLQRYWAKLQWRQGQSRLHPDRLFIGSHGKFIEIGRDLIEEDRKDFAARLQKALVGDPAFDNAR